MKQVVRTLLLFVLVLSFSPAVISQTTTIERIREDAANFDGDAVEFTGLVTQYVHGKGGTSYYMIKGDFGAILRVNTAEPAPETNAKYTVTGIVYIDKENNTPFVSEKSKEKVVPNYPPVSIFITPSSVAENESATIVWDAPKSVRVTLNGNPVENKGSKSVTEKTSTIFTIQAEYPDGTFQEKAATLTITPGNNFLLYGLIAALVLLIAAFVYFQFRRKPIPDTYNIIEDDRKPKNDVYNINVDAQEQKPIYSSDNDFKTIKIVTTSPKTLKFIPGKLVITDGVDKGKEFRIAGYPTPEGFVVTIGRKEVSGDRAYAHIQLKEMTVSREQAELHYSNNKLFVKNLSETNYTQLNGAELKPGQMSEVTPGSTIKTGEVEFKYVL